MRARGARAKDRPNATPGRTDGLIVAVALPKLAMGFAGTFSGVYWVCQVLWVWSAFFGCQLFATPGVFWVSSLRKSDS